MNTVDTLRIYTEDQSIKAKRIAAAILTAITFAGPMVGQVSADESSNNCGGQDRAAYNHDHSGREAGQAIRTRHGEQSDIVRQYRDFCKDEPQVEHPDA